jgi:hypothetical protein
MLALYPYHLQHAIKEKKLGQGSKNGLRKRPLILSFDDSKLL